MEAIGCTLKKCTQLATSFFPMKCAFFLISILFKTRICLFRISGRFGRHYSYLAIETVNRIKRVVSSSHSSISTSIYTICFQLPCGNLNFGYESMIISLIPRLLFHICVVIAEKDLVDLHGHGSSLFYRLQILGFINIKS